jgi:ABC-type transport system substrate-binding protein
VARFEPGVQLDLERNPMYWRKGFPRCDRLSFSFAMTPDRILSEFKAGRFSLAADLYPGDVESLRRDSALAAGYREKPRLSTYLLSMNTHRAPLEDRSVRLRVASAVDMARIVRQTLGGLALPATGLIPPGLIGHDPARAPFRPILMPDRVLEELELTAAVHPVYAGEYSAFTEELLKAFSNAGIKINVISETVEGFMQGIRHGTADVVMGRWVADYPDADTFAYYLHTSGGMSGRLCGTEEIDDLVARGRSESSPTVRHSIYCSVEEIIAREGLLLPLFHEQVYRIARPEIDGLLLSYWAPAVSYEHLTMAGQQ